MPHVHSRTTVRPRTAPRRGFALLITITLLAFLVLLLVSLASLTRVETQVAGNNQQLAQARQNALMALNIAIGQLQKYAGPDQRVTAPADFATGAPAAQTGDAQKGLVTPVAGAKQWLGIWGNSSTPGTIYTATPTPIFLNWLVSGNEQTASPTVAADGHISAPTIASSPSHKPSGITGLTDSIAATDTTSIKINGDAAILLVGPKTAGTTGSDRFVAAPLVNIQSSSVPGLGTTPTTIGRYAYWVGDEGVKAQYGLRDQFTADTDPKTSANARYRFFTPARNGIEVITDLTSYPVNAASLDKITLASQFRLADSTITDAVQQGHIHDLSANSWGVLANTQTGGLRTDLTHALNQASLGSNFSGMTIIPSAVAGSLVPAKSPKWVVLKSFTDLSLQTGQSANIEVRPPTATTAGVSPVIVQTRLLFSINSVPSFFGATTNVPRRFYIQVYPVFVIANPYSFPIQASSGVDFSFAITTDTQSEWGVCLQQRKGDRTTVTPNPTPFDRTKATVYANDGNTYGYYPILANKTYPAVRSVLDKTRFQTRSFTLQPGECKVFSIKKLPLQSSDNSASPSSNDVTLDEGMNLGYYNFNTGTDVPAHPTYGSPAASIRFGYFVRMLYSKAMTIQMAVHGSAALDAAATQPQTGALQTVINCDLTGSNITDTSMRLNDYSVLYTNTGRPPTSPTETNDWLSFGGYGMSLALPIVDASFYQGSTTWMASHRAYADYNLNALNSALPPVVALQSLNTSSSGILDTVPPYTRRYIPGVSTNSSGTANALDTGALQSGVASSPRWGSTTGTSGVTNAILYDVPKGASDKSQSPFFSIAQLQHADLTGDDDYLSVSYQPRYAVGNSNYNPYVLRTTTVDSRSRMSPQPNGVAASGNVRLFDLSYLMNTALWDDYFFSSLRQSGAYVGKPANQRLTFSAGYTPSSSELGIGTGDTPVTDLSGNSTQFLPEKAAARYMMIKGAFNINSTSVDAWKAVLAGGRSLDLNSDPAFKYTTPFARSLNQSRASTDADKGDMDTTYAGYRRLTDGTNGTVDQITPLATQIVSQVRARGPFVSLAHFVNRGLSNDTLGSAGTIQSAIDAVDSDPDPNKKVINTFPRTPDTASSAYTPAYAVNGATDLGNRNINSPGWLSQADILQSIGAVLSARSDTFTVRVYGDVLDPLDSTKVVSRAWCEALIQRFPDYVDTTINASAAPTSNTNKAFGRRFRVISFRWLSASEI